MDDHARITALYSHEVETDPLLDSLRDSGVSDERICIVTPLPLSERTSACIGAVPLYAVTIVAGLIGIGIGVFFAAGTAALYPLMTGGKPIVGFPIVGIISYETMMLTAIVVTFVTMVVAIKRSHRDIPTRDARIDDGCIMIAVSVPANSSQEVHIKALLQQARPVDLYVSNAPPRQRLSEEETDGRIIAAGLAAICFLSALVGCSRDMQEQPSYQPLEAPRLHSPAASVPRDSRSTAMVFSQSVLIDKGVTLFRVNCAHCHGPQGNGDGPVAAYLREKPANLHKPEVQRLSDAELYKIVSHGKGMMPPFQGELSAIERRSVVAHVRSLSDHE